MLVGKISDGKSTSKNYISSSKNATKYIILPLELKTVTYIDH